jgi:hypothetical protein
VARPKKARSQAKPKKAESQARPSKDTLKIVSKPRPQKDEVREERIVMEIVVDAYDEDERAMGWYYHLEEKLNTPFLARCVEERAVSPLNVGDEIEVIAMGPERESRCEMFVTIPWERRTLAVPLAQLEVVHADDQTREAVEDWHYWVRMGYQF